MIINVLNLQIMANWNSDEFIKLTWYGCLLSILKINYKIIIQSLQWKKSTRMEWQTRWNLKKVFDGDINNKIKNKRILHPSPQFHSMMCANYESWS